MAYALVAKRSRQRAVNPPRGSSNLPEGVEVLDMKKLVAVNRLPEDIQKQYGLAGALAAIKIISDDLPYRVSYEPLPKGMRPSEWLLQGIDDA